MRPPVSIPKRRAPYVEPVWFGSLETIHQLPSPIGLTNPETLVSMRGRVAAARLFGGSRAQRSTKEIANGMDYDRRRVVSPHHPDGHGDRARDRQHYLHFDLGREAAGESTRPRAVAWTLARDDHADRAADLH